MKKSMFIFVRHAESNKNIRDITGGKGEQLTEKGKLQAEIVAQKLKENLLCSEVNIITSNIIQAEQTANIIANTLNVEYSVAEDLMPADMGIIGGLTSKQLSEKFPDCALQMKKWRNREIEAIELNIPGMENPIDFWDRMIAYLSKISNNSVNVIVCTRSIMVLAYNIAHGNKPTLGGGYKHFDISNCDMIAFSIELDFNNAIIEKSYTTERLQ